MRRTSSTVVAGPRDGGTSEARAPEIGLSWSKGTLRQLAGALTITALSRIAERGLSFVAVIAVIRFLSPVDSGGFVLMVKVSSIAAIIATVGVPAAAVRIVSQAIAQSDQAKVGAVLDVFLLSRLAFGVVVVTISWVAAEPLADLVLHTPDATILLRLAGVAAATNSVLGFSLSHLQARRRFVTYGMLNAGTTAMKALATVWLAIRHAPAFAVGLPWAVIPMIGAIAGLLLAPWLHSPRETWLASAQDASRELAAYSGWLVVAGVAGAVALNVDVLVVTRFAGLSAVSQYGAATNVALVVTVVGGALYTVLLPTVSRFADRRAIARYFWWALGWGMVLIIPATISAILLSPWIMRLLYGPSFVAAATALDALFVASVASVVYSCAGVAFLAADQPALTAATEVIRMVVVVIALALLVPLVGALGASIAVLTGNVVATAATAAIGFGLFHADTKAVCDLRL